MSFKVLSSRILAMVFHLFGPGDNINWKTMTWIPIRLREESITFKSSFLISKAIQIYPNSSEIFRYWFQNRVSIKHNLIKCPMKPRHFSPLLFQANEALKASRGNTPKDFALVADDGFKHDFRFRSTKRESTPRKRSGISRCWISLSWGIRCWISNQLYEFK